MSEMPTPPTRMSFLGGLPPLVINIAILLGIFVVGGLAGWIGHSVLAGPPDVPTMTVYKDWRLTCPAVDEKDANCRLSQDVVDKQSGQAIANLVYFKETEQSKDGKDGKESMAKPGSTVFAITVPLNVLLEPGLGLKLGADDMKVYQYKTCTQAGCVAVVPIDKEMQKTFLGAQVAEITIVGRDGKPVQLPFSMKGLTNAYNAYRDSEARHSSWWWRLWS